MKRKLVFLNVILGAMALFAGWQIRERYVAAESHASQVLRTTVPPSPAPPVPLTSQATPIQAQSYFSIAEKLLFFKDRNATVVIEKAQEAAVPSFPVAFGVMDFGSGATAVMSPRLGAEQKSYRAGDKVGEFLLASLTTKEVVLEWEGKKFTKQIDELKVKDAPPPVAANDVPRGDPGGKAPVSTNLGPLKPADVESMNRGSADVIKDVQKGMSDGQSPGLKIGGASHACAVGDTSPPGTVQNGYRKVVITAFTGPVCMWEPIGR